MSTARPIGLDLDAAIARIAGAKFVRRTAANVKVFKIERFSAFPGECNLWQIKSVNHEWRMNNLQTWLKGQGKRAEVDNKQATTKREWMHCTVASATNRSSDNWRDRFDLQSIFPAGSTSHFRSPLYGRMVNRLGDGIKAQG